VPTTEPAPAVPSPTRLLIPAINLEATIVKVGFVNYEIGGQRVSTWAVPERFAVGWHHNSALPGQIGNTVLNGHQNVYGRVFRDLNKLQAGDEIFVYVGENAHRYLVAEQHLLAEEGQPLEVRVENARWILPTQDERLTLVTCAPDTSSTHRLIVVAFPID
jgi:sortase A